MLPAGNLASLFIPYTTEIYEPISVVILERIMVMDV